MRVRFLRVAPLLGVCMEKVLYCYVEPDDDGSAVVVKRTRQELLKDYYPYWSCRMHEAGLTSDPDQCIEDWLEVHWGWIERED